MLNLVLTYRLSRKKTWESYWRALLNDDTSHIANAESYAAAGMGKLLPCTTPSKAKEGPWTYNPQTGRLRIAFWDGEDPVAKTAVRLFGVHWNFRGDLLAHTVHREGRFRGAADRGSGHRLGHGPRRAGGNEAGDAHPRRDLARPGRACPMRSGQGLWPLVCTDI